MDGERRSKGTGYVPRYCSSILFLDTIPGSKGATTSKTGELDPTLIVWKHAASSLEGTVPYRVAPRWINQEMGLAQRLSGAPIESCGKLCAHGTA